MSPDSATASPALAPADDRLSNDERIEVIPTPAAFDVHEWGVWQLDARGRVRSLEDVARESPSFVHRLPGVPTAPAELAPVPDVSGYQVFDKPVVFFYADAPLDVTFEVRTPRGRPWLYYPDAVVGRVGRDLALRFSGQLLATSPLPTGLGYAEPPGGHWWSILRGVGASPFVTRDGREAERFLFYDGVGAFPRGFTRTRRALVPIAGAVEPVAWRIEGRTLTRLDFAGTSVTRTPLGANDRIFDALRVALVARGLTAAESESLLATWRPELGRAGETRTIWLLPRAAYDAMLPATITPRPRTFVRVGVVIERE